MNPVIIPDLNPMEYSDQSLKAMWMGEIIWSNMEWGWDKFSKETGMLSYVKRDG